MVDLAVDPANGNRLLVSVIGSAAQSGVWLSTNALSAATFARQLALAGTGSSTARTELTINNVGGVVTAFAASADAGGTVYRSVDGGVNWTLQIDNNFCGGQCFYNIAVAVDPNNASNVYIGGTGTTTTFGRSTNGGTTFTNSQSGLHTDTQALAVAPSLPTTIYFGSDGGIYKSTDSGVSWASLNNTTFRATQFTSIAVHPTDPNFTSGGTQDNGTLVYNAAAAWDRIASGDGGFALIDQNANNTTSVESYSTFFNNSLQKGYVHYDLPDIVSFFDLRGCFGNVPGNGIPCGGAVLFYAPLEQGPGNPNTVYYGSTILYRSADTGANHTAVSQDMGNRISAIGISRQNDNVRIIGTEAGQLFGTTTNSSTLIDLDPLNTVPNNYVGRAVIDPNNVNTGYVTLCAFGITNIWKTTTLSSLVNNIAPTWTVANNGLPQIPVNAFVVNPTNSNQLFAGTDIGVYASTDGGANWLPFGTGLPRVPVFDMAITSASILRIATHGRGMWQISTAAPTAANVSVSGRVIAGNRGLTNAIVTMTDQNGVAHSTRTSSFGNYRFDNVEVGQTYVVSVRSKRFQFAPQVVNVVEELSEFNFYSNEN
jgi:Carboxypeptidase regulatory-like domain